MKRLPLTPEVEAVAQRVFWFEEPAKAIADPVRFLAYAMTYGSIADVTTLRRYLSDDDLREALSNAPPGIFDPRSWAYWNLMLGRYPTPPMPEDFFDQSKPRRRALSNSEFDNGVDANGFPR
jgi:hypothetical protein